MAEHWHLSKGVSLSTISTLVVTIILGSMAYGETQNKLKELQKDVAAATSQHVSKESVGQMLANRDIKIQIVSDDVKDLKSKVDENQKLLQQILREMPRKSQ